MKISETIDTVTDALRNGASPRIMKLALMSDGIPPDKSDTIIAWAKLQVERESNDEEGLYQSSGDGS